MPAVPVPDEHGLPTSDALPHDLLELATGADDAGVLDSGDWVSGLDTGATALQSSHNYQWIQIDLGATHAVNQLSMLWNVGRHARGYSVYMYHSACGGWCHLGSTTQGDGDDTLTLRQPVHGRYFLLWLVFPATSYASYELAEWRIFGAGASVPPTGVNVARGRPAVASSSIPGSPPHHATDGSTATAWQSTGVPAWIYVDLGTARVIDRAVLRWVNGLHGTMHALYRWAGTGWQGVYVNYSGAGGDEVASFEAVQTRYLALYAAEGVGPRIGLAEFEIYTAAAGAGGGYRLELEPDLEPNGLPLPTNMDQ
jgi:hypothetical protein